jgi:hypothetical protein
MISTTIATTTSSSSSSTRIERSQLKVNQASKAINPYETPTTNSPKMKDPAIDPKPESRFPSRRTGRREHIYLKEVPPIV